MPHWVPQWGTPPRDMVDDDELPCSSSLSGRAAIVQYLHMAAAVPEDATLPMPAAVEARAWSAFSRNLTQLRQSGPV